MPMHLLWTSNLRFVVWLHFCISKPYCCKYVCVNKFTWTLTFIRYNFIIANANLYTNGNKRIGRNSLSDSIYLNADIYRVTILLLRWLILYTNVIGGNRHSDITLFVARISICTRVKYVEICRVHGCEVRNRLLIIFAIFNLSYQGIVLKYKQMVVQYQVQQLKTKFQPCNYDHEVNALRQISHFKQIHLGSASVHRGCV